MASGTSASSSAASSRRCHGQGACPTMSPKCGTSAMLRGVVSLLRSSLARDLGRFSSPLPSPLPAMCAGFAAAAQRAPPATTLTRPPCSAPIPERAADAPRRCVCRPTARALPAIRTAGHPRNAWPAPPAAGESRSEASAASRSDCAPRGSPATPGPGRRCRLRPGTRLVSSRARGCASALIARIEARSRRSGTRVDQRVRRGRPDR